MGSEWQKVEIGRLAKLRSGFSFKSSDWKDSGVPVIKIANVKGGRIISDGCGFVAADVASKSAEWYTQTDDVLIAMTGYVGEVAQVRRGERYLINQRVGRFEFITQAEVDSTYFFYHLQHPDTRAEIEGVARGSAQPNLSAGDVHKIKITLPPLKFQREIAATLRALDDRITLLRETNATLEAIAQALFKSWFVDFDPVRAKMEGRVPDGMDESTAALFPDALVESELGLLPKGWSASPLAEAFEINPSRKLSKGLMASYLDMASLATSGHCVESPIQRAMGSGAKFQNGDTLLARITPCLENGKSAFVDFLAEGQVGWGSTEFLVLRPKAPLAEYLGYLLCRHPAFRECAIQSMSGTSGRQRIQNDVLGRYLLPVPDREVAVAVGNIVGPIQQSIAANHQTAQSLATLRDTLLPRLISGQLRLPEALEEAAQ